MLLVGLQISAATMENSTEIPQKIKNRDDPAIPLLGVYLKKMKSLTQKDTCTRNERSLHY